MKRHEFYTAIGAADKYFNTSEPEFADDKLTIREHQKLCAEAEARVRTLFPAYADRIMITPVRDPEDEYAGYRFLFENGSDSFEESFEFDFGSVGVDVV